MNTRSTLSQIVRNPEFLPRCADVTTRLTKAADDGEVTALLAEAVDIMGADSAAFGSFIKDDESFTSYRFILFCDERWCQRYEDGACFMHDPWLDYARHHSEPVLARTIAARTEREHQVVALTRHYGFESAIIVPTQGPQGLTRLGALCIGSSQPGYFESEAFASVAFVAVPLTLRLQEWQVSQLRKELMDRAHLTDSDLLLLRHARDGLSSKETAAALRLNPIAVDSRWQRLNARLGVDSRVSAACKAAEYGVI